MAVQHGGARDEPEAVTGPELRAAVLAHLAAHEPQTAYEISRAMRRRFPSGATQTPVLKALAALKAAGFVRRTEGTRTGTDRRLAIRWGTP